MRPGQSCWKVKRAAEAFTESIQTSGTIKERSPEAELSNLPGGAAYMAKRTLNELANLIALHDNDPVSFYTQLELENHFEEDSDGNEKREALPEPWCLRPGQSCWKREAEAEDPVAKDKRWCLRPGQSCWKAKRAAEAVLDVVGREAEALEDKPFAPALARSANPEPWCLRPGQSCWKREADAEPEPQWCMRPGQSCWKAKRDIQSMQVAARAVLTALE
jgi:hypothetical protein